MPVFNPFQPWTYQPPKPSRKAPIEGHPPIWHGPVKGPPLPKSVIEEVLRQYREAMRHGELPIAYGPGGLITVPNPTPTATICKRLHPKHQRLLHHLPVQHRQPRFNH